MLRTLLLGNFQFSGEEKLENRYFWNATLVKNTFLRFEKQVLTWKRYNFRKMHFLSGRKSFSDAPFILWIYSGYIPVVFRYRLGHFYSLRFCSFTSFSYYFSFLSIFPLVCAYIEIPFFSCSLEERRK